jgi:dienelactone hydrolase
MKRLTVFLLIGLYSSLCFSVELQLLPDKSLGFERHLLTFENDNLVQHALLVVGSSAKLKSNTLIVMVHGFHPNPAQYGKIEGGVSSRPGNYYREWVNAYAKAGFNVLVPDYRGHNDSQGLSYTHQVGAVDFPEQYYGLDLIASVKALQDHLQLTRPKLVFVGHSMGSPIAFYAAEQFTSQVKLVSLWSSAAYRFPAVTAAPKYVIHHGKYDEVTPITHLDYYLKKHKNQLVSMNIYETNNHLLSASDFEQAVALDIRLINGILKDK